MSVRILKIASCQTLSGKSQLTYHIGCARVPGLALGGVHGRNEKKVYEKLCDLVEEWIEIYGEDNAPLPTATAGKQYSGKFNLRVGEELHERLAIESMKVSESLNSYCVKVLKDEFGL